MRAVIPRRSDLPGDRGVLIVSYATHKKKAYSFFLVQVRRREGSQHYGLLWKRVGVHSRVGPWATLGVGAAGMGCHVAFSGHWPSLSQCLG